MNKTVLKIGAIAIGIFLFAFGSTYLFNHVNPWIGKAVQWVGIIVIAAIAVNQIVKWCKDEES